jgi:hypothetical protein
MVYGESEPVGLFFSSKKSPPPLPLLLSRAARGCWGGHLSHLAQKSPPHKVQTDYPPSAVHIEVSAACPHAAAHLRTRGRAARSSTARAPGPETRFSCLRSSLFLARVLPIGSGCPATVRFASVPSGMYQWAFAKTIGSADSPPPRCPPRVSWLGSLLSVERGRAA